jgi:hypothetical protein
MRKPKLSSIVLLSFGFIALAARTQAQTAPAPAPATAPPPPAAEATTPAPTPETGAPAIPAPCFPACRDGFLCGAEGQCISACNPACGAGERCTGQGHCVIDATVAPVAPITPVAPPPPAYPPPAAPVPEEGVETHDGILLRFTIGLGGGGMGEELDGDDSNIDYTGGGLLWAVDVGAGITDTLTVQARLGQTLFFGPQKEIDGEEDELDEGRNLSASLFGAGLTYHFMPINLYVTAIGGLSELRITDGQNPDEYDEDDPTIGFGMNLDVGKEWWVVPQTGIGVAGRFVWATGGSENARGRPDGPSDRNLIAFGVVFSVTHQ